jgi:hypothetical protein
MRRCRVDSTNRSLAAFSKLQHIQRERQIWRLRQPANQSMVRGLATLGSYRDSRAAWRRPEPALSVDGRLCSTSSAVKVA